MRKKRKEERLWDYLRNRMSNHKRVLGENEANYEARMIYNYVTKYYK